MRDAVFMQIIWAFRRVGCGRLGRYGDRTKLLVACRGELLLPSQSTSMDLWRRALDGKVMLYGMSLGDVRELRDLRCIGRLWLDEWSTWTIDIETIRVTKDARVKLGDEVR
jgi:hypothetical protein